MAPLNITTSPVPPTLLFPGRPRRAEPRPGQNPLIELHPLVDEQASEQPRKTSDLDAYRSQSHPTIDTTPNTLGQSQEPHRPLSVKLGLTRRRVTVSFMRRSSVCLSFSHLTRLIHGTAVLEDQTDLTDEVSSSFTHCFGSALTNFATPFPDDEKRPSRAEKGWAGCATERSLPRVSV